MEDLAPGDVLGPAKDLHMDPPPGGAQKLRRCSPGNCRAPRNIKSGVLAYYYYICVFYYLLLRQYYPLLHIQWAALVSVWAPGSHGRLSDDLSGNIDPDPLEKGILPAKPGSRG